MKFNSSDLQWLHRAQRYSIADDRIEIETSPHTDLWQRTYYGFQHDNAPALLLNTEIGSFSFYVKAEFHTTHQFDQCGVLIYQDSDNWCKASAEYENELYQRLGSVVTNHGYSDWATTDIAATIDTIFYKLSRRGSDFCVETSYDGIEYKQMRIFHLFAGDGAVRVGIYACSPGASSFTAVFSEMSLTDCAWPAHT